MPKQSALDYFRSKGLLPFQAKPLVDFLQEPTASVWQIVSPPGIGKTFMACALVAHEMNNRSGCRVLVLGPALLLPQWANRLTEFSPSIKCTLVTRRKYLELEAAASNGSDLWPASSVILVSIDLAKQEDIATSLARSTWDLVIVDEAHLLVGKRRALLDNLRHQDVASRVILLTTTPSKLVDNSVIRTIDPAELIDWDGKPLLSKSNWSLQTLSYCRSDDEREVIHSVKELTRLTGNPFLENTLVKSASSSVFALDSALQRLIERWRPVMNKIAHSMSIEVQDLQLLAGPELPSMNSDPAQHPLHSFADRPHDFLAAFEKMESLVDKLSDLSVDPKLNTFLEHAQQFFADEKQRHLCVLCNLHDTAQYLRACLEQHDLNVYAVTGATTFEERKSAFEAFQERGGCLVTTDAVSEGVDLKFVEQCVNFDLPLSIEQFEQRLGRFLRYSRQGKLEMIILQDVRNSIAFESEIIQSLGRLAEDSTLSAKPPGTPRDE